MAKKRLFQENLEVDIYIYIIYIEVYKITL